MAEAQKRRIVFMGTPAFAATVLSHLLAEPSFEVVGVFTKPDAKSGRGMKSAFSEVKKLALAQGLPVWQPATLRNGEAKEVLKALAPEFIVSASYGLILPQEILDLATVAPLNVHASLLPNYRGAAPIQRAIMENWGPEAITGISIMKMEAGLDTGPVYAKGEIRIDRKNQQQVSLELAETGGQLLVDTIKKIHAENLAPIPQDDARATIAAKLSREDGKIDWRKSAFEVDALVRGVTPWPGASTIFEINGSKIPLVVLAGSPRDDSDQHPPGQIHFGRNAISVACGRGWYDVEKLKPQGRKSMNAGDFINGLRLAKNEWTGRACL